MPGVLLRRERLIVALQAHLVRIALELQRFRVGGCVRRVRIMTVPAVSLAFAEAGGTLKSFYDESSFPESTIPIERFA
jgi:hypothetical protein